MTRAEVNWADRDQVADYLAETALTLSGLVREDDPVAVARWVRGRVPAEEWVAFAIVLAAMVPVDLTSGQLLGWVRFQHALGLSPAVKS